MWSHQALNHIYKDLVSIVITQSTDKDQERGREEGKCVCMHACLSVFTSFCCVCGFARVYLSMDICVYPCEEQRMGIIFSLHAHMCVREHACMWVTGLLKVS